jgi:4-nitrophenyl phosphatase
MTLRAIDTLLIDLDGVVYTGNTPVADAPGFFEFLRRTRRRFQCITNNSTLTPEQYSDKLAAMGIDVAAGQVLTSSQATALHLQERLPRGSRILAIGEGGLVRALTEQGYRLATRSPDAVVCGYDRRLTYERLKQAALAIRAGAAFIATNPDLTLPTEAGLLPGNGATLAYLQATTGATPEVIGKPEATMLHIAMERMDVSPGQTAMVGDGLLTDMLAAQRAGVTKILLLTGVARREHIATAPAAPDLVFESLTDLQRALGER